VVTTPDEPVVATRQAIADATVLDARDINRSFDYDYDAYGEVKSFVVILTQGFSGSRPDVTQGFRGGKSSGIFISGRAWAIGSAR
jgi:hypothetical protein